MNTTRDITSTVGADPKFAPATRLTEGILVSLLLRHQTSGGSEFVDSGNRLDVAAETIEDVEFDVNLSDCVSRHHSGTMATLPFNFSTSCHLPAVDVNDRSGVGYTIVRACKANSDFAHRVGLLDNEDAFSFDGHTPAEFLPDVDHATTQVEMVRSPSNRFVRAFPAFSSWTPQPCCDH